MIDSSVILSKKTQTEPCLELHLIRQAYTVAVGLKIGIIIHGLVAVKQRDDILFVDFPISARLIADFLQVPGIECLDTDKGSQRE